MKSFTEWLTHLDLLARLSLIESYYSFDPAEYNRLFQEELEKLLQRITEPTHREALEGMRGFDWVGYIAASVRGSGGKIPVMRSFMRPFWHFDQPVGRKVGI